MKYSTQIGMSRALTILLLLITKSNPLPTLQDSPLLIVTFLGTVRGLGHPVRKSRTITIVLT